MSVRRSRSPAPVTGAAPASRPPAPFAPAAIEDRQPSPTAATTSPTASKARRRAPRSIRGAWPHTLFLSQLVFGYVLGLVPFEAHRGELLERSRLSRLVTGGVGEGVGVRLRVVDGLASHGALGVNELVAEHDLIRRRLDDARPLLGLVQAGRL